MSIKHYLLGGFVFVICTLALVACQSRNPLYATPSFAWDTVSPATAGMDEGQLDAAFDDAFADGAYTQAALVIKDGKLVYERYKGATENESDIYQSVYPGSKDFDVRTKNSLASSWSMAKSFVSILVGIAIDQGHIKSIEEPASCMALPGALFLPDCYTMQVASLFFGVSMTPGIFMTSTFIFQQFKVPRW